MAHLTDGRHVETDRDQRRMWFAMGNRLDWVWDTSPLLLAHLWLGGKEQ
ncbi:MAG: hypothetical protein ABIO96_03985 [Nitrospiraceae bacterium]